jgi:hypothetical protein
MQVSSHTFTYFSTLSPWTLRHLSYRDTSLLIPSSYQTAAWLFNQSKRYPTCTNFVVLVLKMFGDNFVHNCTRHIRTLFVHFASCEMSFSARIICANVLYFPNNLIYILILLFSPEDGCRSSFRNMSTIPQKVMSLQNNIRITHRNCVTLCKECTLAK